MSLTSNQMLQTQEEFQKNLVLSGLSLSEIARDLKTSISVIENTLQLQTTRIEDPWVLKNYLEEQIIAQNKQPIPFTALVGNYQQYWFLNSKRIKNKRIG
ncbi:DUF2316 family protein [Enterococcus sp. LJL128]|uniref:DUF2316 family protein n=1 Tax=Enterococcus sp. LJL51 TaxID=3416656 RepID=UPI003CEF78EC